MEELTHTGITIIMIEQKLEKLAKYCDRIILMDKGCVIDFDTPEKIFSRKDLLSIGVQPPAYTRICAEHGLTLPDGTYPVKLEDTERLFKESNSHLDPKSTEIKESEPSDVKDRIFKIEDLDFHYIKGVPIFEKLGLSLDRRPTAIIGQNGAGKTTLVRILKGLLKPVSGRVYFGEEDISKKTVAMLADKVGYVFQNPDDQIFKYKVLDEVMFGPLNIGMSPEKAKEESLKALELMGLKGMEEMNPYDLELYERKMTAIASVVAMDTDVVILDEPTIAQDYKGRQLIGGMIRELSKKGKLIIAILHDMDFVEEYFERVIVMAHGRILCDGSASYVFSRDAELEEARLQKPYITALRERFKN